jgi:hypothetical protein
LIQTATTLLSCNGNNEIAIESYKKNLGKNKLLKLEGTLKKWCKLFVENQGEDSSNSNETQQNEITCSESQLLQTNSCLNNSSDNLHLQVNDLCSERQQLSQSSQLQNKKKTILEDYGFSQNSQSPFDNLDDLPRLDPAPLDTFKILSEKAKKTKKGEKRGDNIVKSISKCYNWIFSALKRKGILKGSPQKLSSKNQAIPLFLEIARKYHQNQFEQIKFDFGD